MASIHRLAASLTADDFVDIFTVLPVFLGALLAIYLPTEKQKTRRGLWIAGFAVLAVLGLVANRAARAQSKKENDQNKLQLSTDLANVKAQGDSIQRQSTQIYNQATAILKFVSRPPRGLTQEQVAAVATEFLAAIKTPSPVQTTAPVASMQPLPSPADTPITEDARKRGLQLAQEIDDWITSVSKDEPSSSRAKPPTPEEQAQDEKYVERLNSEWTTKFAGRADRSVGELHVKQIIYACRVFPSDDPDFILAMRTSCAYSIRKAASTH